MMNVAIRGLWRGHPVAELVVIDLEPGLNEQQKQVARLLLDRIAPDLDVDTSKDETPVDFATRLGFSKLDYQYQDGRQVIVDVLDPSKAI
jgi:hypothetical protein